jgi:heat shock 70kDa protein 1/2/6/8
LPTSHHEQAKQKELEGLVTPILQSLSGGGGGGPMPGAGAEAGGMPTGGAAPTSGAADEGPKIEEID